MDAPDAADLDAVRQRLGRDPQGAFAVVVRDDAGAPVVIENAPLLDDGTPMPTRYWLVAPDEVRAVSRLEADGGVRAAEAAVDAAELARAHERYAAERDQALAPDHSGPRPAGGVGGTRTGVKCLHAHYAWHLAGGDDPVGRWVDAQLRRRLDVAIEASTVVVSHAGHDFALPVGPAVLLAEELGDADPPAPGQLTNAIGAVADHVDDVLRWRPAVVDASDVRLRGDEAWHLARVERGHEPDGAAVRLSRDEAEEVFRALATERRADRLHNPGLDPGRVDSVVATCCVLVGLMRKLHLDAVVVSSSTSGGLPR
jgi:hypothetical protein